VSNGTELSKVLVSLNEAQYEPDHYPVEETDVMWHDIRSALQAVKSENLLLDEEEEEEEEEDDSETPAQLPLYQGIIYRHI
jgi:hypothetical protein